MGGGGLGVKGTDFSSSGFVYENWLDGLMGLVLVSSWWFGCQVSD